LREFHQIYNIGAVEYVDEIFIFAGQKIKGQGQSETKYGQMNILQTADILNICCECRTTSSVINAELYSHINRCSALK